MDWVTIGPARQEIRGDRTRITYDVQGLAASELWFEVDGAYGEFVDDSCDAAVVALLVAAMIAEKPLRVEGPVSARLAWGVRNILIPVVTRQLPLAPIEVCGLASRFPTIPGSPTSFTSTRIRLLRRAYFLCALGTWATQ